MPLQPSSARNRRPPDLEPVDEPERRGRGRQQRGAERIDVHGQGPVAVAEDRIGAGHAFRPLRLLDELLDGVLEPVEEQRQRVRLVGELLAEPGGDGCEVDRHPFSLPTGIA